MENILYNCYVSIFVFFLFTRILFYFNLEQLAAMLAFKDKNLTIVFAKSAIVFGGQDITEDVIKVLDAK